MIVNSKYNSYLDFQLDMKVFQSVILNSQVDLESYRQEIIRELEQETPIKSFDTIRYQLSDLVSADYVIEYNNELDVPEDELLLDFDEIGGSEEYDIVDELDEGFDDIEDIKSRCVINYDYSPLSIEQVKEINEAYSKFLDSDLEEFTGNIAELEDEIEKVKQNDAKDEESSISDEVVLEEEVIDFSNDDSEEAEYDIEDELSGESSTYEEDEDENEEYGEYYDEDNDDSDSEEVDEEEYDFDNEEEDEYYIADDEEEEYDSDESEEYDSDEDEDSDESEEYNDEEEEYDSDEDEEYEVENTDEDEEYSESYDAVEDVTNLTEKHITDDGEDNLFEPEFDNIESNNVDKSVISEKVKEEPKEETPKIKEDEPKDLIQFIRKHPRCEVSFALQYFSKKEIEKNIMMGRIIKKGNKLYF